MKESPCLPCTKRHANCHAWCDEYIAFAKEREEYRNEVRDWINKDAITCNNKRWDNYLRKKKNDYIRRGKR